MRINILKKISKSTNYAVYKICAENIYLTKMDLFYGALSSILQCANLQIPFNYKIEEIEHLSLYKIIDQNKTELFIIEIIDASGPDFD